MWQIFNLWPSSGVIVDNVSNVRKMSKTGEKIPQKEESVQNDVVVNVQNVNGGGHVNAETPSIPKRR